MGVVKDDLPTIRVIMPAEMKKYQYPGKINEITVESVGTFVQDVLDADAVDRVRVVAAG